VQDQVSLVDLRKMWSAPNPGTLPGSPLLVSPETVAAISGLWGQPAEGAVAVISNEALLDEAWKRRTSWAIVPFEDLEPRWKVLRVDGRSPIDKPFDVANYALKVAFVIQGQVQAEAALSTLVPAEMSFLTNEDPQGITTVVTTGVTALTRATAYAMEKKGLTYPGRDIRDWLALADITHISNEVSFYADCPYPNPASDLLYFCSRPSYLSLLEYVGADVVELSGNHNNDTKAYYGADVYGSTLELYAGQGMQTFAGGMNVEDARKPAILERNGMRFAFLGCNAAGPPAAWATESSPGAAPCEDNQWLIDAIRQEREQGNLPIVTFQYFENYIDSALEPEKALYRQVADAGALVVDGSQAHTPKGMEFYHGAFIHYGLGNLFFDQMQMTATRQEFIDRHVFYGGKEISVELLTAMLEDYARPRPMTAGERAAFLTSIFKASGW
jgi:poly-gamma-glutamate synthesis protein (capsule biosynthesis protein)